METNFPMQTILIDMFKQLQNFMKRDRRDTVMAYEKTLLLTGSGSVENSWQPIKKSLKHLYGKYLPELQISDLNLVFADIVYQLRWLFATKSAANTTDELKQDLENKFKETYATYQKIKERIADELKQALDLP